MLLSTGIAYITNLKVLYLSISHSQWKMIGGINRWPISTILLFVIFLILYKVLPHTRVMLADILPGALFSTIGWKSAEFGYMWYMSHMAKIAEVYGSIGGMVGILLWFYIAAAVFLLGAEFIIVNLRLKQMVKKIG